VRACTPLAGAASHLVGCAWLWPRLCCARERTGEINICEPWLSFLPCFRGGYVCAWLVVGERRAIYGCMLLLRDSARLFSSVHLLWCACLAVRLPCLHKDTPVLVWR